MNVPHSDWTQAYARQLLRELGAAPAADLPEGRHPALAWAESGLMALTGRPGGPPRMCPAPLTACADGVLAALRAMAPNPVLDSVTGAGLLAERIAIMDLQRSGSVSAGGACRLLQAGDGWLALSLARDSDWELLPAWLACDPVSDWDALARRVAGLPVSALIERGRLLGLPLAPDNPPRRQPVSWLKAASRGMQAHVKADHEPVVLDLSSLWAGPLCARLLRRLGARVIKLESQQRPDGARFGPPAFFSLMNGGKEMLSLDWQAASARNELLALIEQADIVIEASRPRALRQFGIDAEQQVAERPGLTWISITGYGRAEPQAGWVGFGDDVAVAAGLSSIMYEVTGERLFCGDAIADPLTGLHAALAAWHGWRSGGGVLYDLTMRDVVTHCVQFDLPDSPSELHDRHGQWTAIAQPFIQCKEVA